MIKELIKLANHLDSKGLIKEADYLDRIIKTSTSILPVRTHATTGQKITGCQNGEEKLSDYCKKLMNAKKNFTNFMAKCRSGKSKKLHNEVCKRLIDKGLTIGMQEDWFDSIWAMHIDKPDAFDANEHTAGDLTAADLHNALENLPGAEKIKKFDPYKATQSFGGSVTDLLTSNEDRDANPYGEFLNDLIRAVL